MGETKKERGATIADFVRQTKERKIPLVHQEAGINELIDAFVGSCHSRLLYVVDTEKRLKGIISLGNLIRHVFFPYHDSHVDCRNLISVAVSETARDFMQREPQFALLSDNVEDVLQRMISYNIKEIPILDKNRRVVADITVIDFLDQYESDRKQDQTST
ncbi:MAG: hypothetical protein BA868_08250 [Desulfobacterales bacterium C00003106]|nr:MAG: hypothetical protein BA868_08250 [Desulfobacterales bacterium C00003106]